ncbi:RHS repeat-associated core domain-containing protein [Streptomyces sp. F63]|uniref:RHS repeat domain-containing protein n=1 Tax=Streptomyces sp. F63 TaxID=2824887 RepID=UPI0027DDC358|nr:RHS repeat-associated core domain-containing protein [Streptomyces sp. F63]
MAYLLAGLLAGPVAVAAELQLRKLQQPDPVPVSEVDARRLNKPDEVAKDDWKPDSKAAWPAPGTVTTAVPGAGKGKRVKAGSLPLALAAAEDKPRSKGGAIAERVQVQVLDRKAADRVGTDGVLIAVRAQGAKKGTDDFGIELDYSGFAGMYGGDWASRLVLRKMPDCVLSTPRSKDCAPGEILSTRNDREKGTLSAEVETDVVKAGAQAPDAPVASSSAGARSLSGAVSSGTTLFAVTAAPSGATGDFTATSLAPSGKWEAGGSSGGFSWTYDMETPAVPGGLEPDLGLSYSSQAIDGRTATTNNQANWIGDGWSLSPGSIERRYVSCEDDKKDGNNPSHKVGDQCWKKENATLSLGGSSSELVKDDDTGEWRKKNDDGTKIAQLKSSNRGNGDNDGEYWRVTAPDGTRYYFGYNRLPGWADGKPETNSVWTVPVFGNHSGEACHAETFKDSWCQQAWRWHLDYVVDPHSNAMAYYWSKESNRYQRNINASYEGTPTDYTRGGYLKRIEYGLRSNRMYADQAVAKAEFTVAERCLPTDTFDCATDKFTEANAKKWPDVPFDQYCASGATCEGNSSPSYFTRKRLTGVTTSALNGGAYKKVDSWELKHDFPAAGDGTDPALWLKSITRTGHTADSAVTLPAVSFRGQQLPNRVEGAVDEIPPYNRYRVYGVDTETGGTVGVTYSARQCAADNLPTPSSNTKRCYPVIWSPPDAPAAGYEPYQDWFHSYVVTQILESDNTAGAPVKRTDYSYLGGLAWAKGDDEFTKAKHRTYGDRKGYERVQTRAGDPAQGTQTLSETRYFRGTTGAKVPDGEGNEATDHEAFAGMTRETATYNGVGGDLVSATSHIPWRSSATATHSRTADGLPAVHAYRTGVKEDRSRTTVAGAALRRTETSRTFDSYGKVDSVSRTGDTAKSGDERCTSTTYARNTDKNILTLVAESTTVAKPCGTTPDLPGDLISVNRSYYDGATTLDAAPTKGDETRRDENDGAGTGFVTVSTATYDAFGRQTAATDASGATTTISRTPAAGQTPTETVSTNELGHATAEFTDPLRGTITASVDANDKRTDVEYDALGRVLRAWAPGWAKADHPAQPSAEYAYRISRTSPNVVTAKTINRLGEYDTSYTFYDGLLRQRETQSPAIGDAGGSVITENLYDTRGQTRKTYGAYYAPVKPSTTLREGDDTKVPAGMEMEYDGAGRTTAAIALKFGDETKRTTTVHGGDRTTVIPPQGGTATTTITDALGRKTESRAHTNADRTEFQATTYAYDRRGNLTKMTDPSGTVWTWTYDARGRQTVADDPDKGLTRTAYDDADRPFKVTDARGIELTTIYDELGRQKELKQGSELRASWTYDVAAKGLPSSSTSHVDGQSYATRVNTYNDRYQPMSSTTTLPAGAGALAGDYTWTFGYNKYTGTQEWVKHPALGNLPGERQTTVFGEGDLPQKTTIGSIVLVNATSHDVFSRPVRTEYGVLGRKVYRTQNWDEHTGDLTRSTLDGDEVLRIEDTRYGYDAAGNVQRVSSTSGQGETASTDTQCFSVDALRRMTDAWTTKNADDTCAAGPSASTVGGPDAYWHSYTYDVASHRTKETRHATAAGSADITRTYTPGTPADDNPHALRSVTTAGGPEDGTTETFTYDEAGNTTSRTGGPRDQQLTWSPEGRLATLTENGKTTEYLYDSSGNRLLAKEADGSATAYLPGGNELKTTSTGTKTATRYYTHGDETIAVRNSSGIHFLFGDRQGTALIAVAWGAGQAVTRRKQLPFGSPRTSSGTSNWPGDRGFLGGTTDPTGLTHLGAREYDPDLGRFLSVDPLLLTDDPTQHNPYTYGNNNPATNADPTGEAIEECVQGKIACSGGLPKLTPKINSAVSGGNPGSPGNSGSYIPWTPGSKKRIFANPSKGRYNSYGHRGHNSYGQTTSAAQKEYNDAYREERRLAYTKAQAERNKKDEGFWSKLGESSWGWTKDTFGTWDGWKNRVLPGAAFGACLVVSAGTCAAAGVAVVGATFIGDGVTTGSWNYATAARGLAWTLMGGAAARKLAGGWRGSAFVTRTRVRTVHQAENVTIYGYRKTVDWGATYANVSINTGLSTTFCGAGAASPGSAAGWC